MRTQYRITDEDDLRHEFWQTFPDLPSERITDYSGNGKMYRTDTRCAWVDWIDSLSKDGSISEDLASSATLD
jgi:hypothetical protein